MLAVFLITGLVTGIVLGLGYRAFVLLPTSLVVTILLVVFTFGQNHTPLRVLLETGATLTCLDFGYLLGLLLHSFPVKLRLFAGSPGQRRAHSRSGGGWAAGPQ